MPTKTEILAQITNESKQLDKDSMWLFFFSENLVLALQRADNNIESIAAVFEQQKQVIKDMPVFDENEHQRMLGFYNGLCASLKVTPIAPREFSLSSKNRGRGANSDSEFPLSYKDRDRDTNSHDDNGDDDNDDQVGGVRMETDDELKALQNRALDVAKDRGVKPDKFLPTTIDLRVAFGSNLEQFREFEKDSTIAPPPENSGDTADDRRTPGPEGDASPKVPKSILKKRS